jgi:hypothetical protein
LEAFAGAAEGGNMKVRDDIHFTLAVLATLAQRLPDKECLDVCDMMCKLLDINREVGEKT